MATKISYCNPLRFRPRDSNYIDYINNYPAFDLMQFNQDYQRGIYANPNYKSDFPLDTEIKIQINDSINVTIARVVNIETGGTYGMTISNVTPSGWADPEIINLEILTNTLGLGIYRIEFFAVSESKWYISDDFKVIDPSVKKDLVQIQYYDAKNNFDGVFYDYDLSSWIWQPINYFTGQVIKGGGSNEYSIYNDDPGVITKTKSIPQSTFVLNLTDISQLETDIINMIFSCDNIYVNGMNVQNSEIQDYAPIEKSDLCNVSIKLTIINSNGYSYNFL